MKEKKKTAATTKRPKLSERTTAFLRRMKHPEDKVRNAREMIAEMLAGPRKQGKPQDPEIRALMEREGLSRQAAWYRLRKATGRRPGRPRKKGKAASKSTGGK